MVRRHHQKSVSATELSKYSPSISPSCYHSLSMFIILHHKRNPSYVNMVLYLMAPAKVEVALAPAELCVPTKRSRRQKPKMLRPNKSNSGSVVGSPDRLSNLFRQCCGCSKRLRKLPNVSKNCVVKMEVIHSYPFLVFLQKTILDMSQCQPHLRPHIRLACPN